MPFTMSKERTFATYRDDQGRVAEVPTPTVDQLDRWSSDSVCEALDGCRVEHDGYCEHGLPSWFIALGYV